MENCAFNNGDNCVALTKKECEGCAFYKTREELVEGRRKATERINGLPGALQTRISNKYYSGGAVCVYRGGN